MSELRIGAWVRRDVGANYGSTLLHKVESVVAEAAITKCGRRMEPVTGARSSNHLEVWMAAVSRGSQPIGPGADLCKNCAR